MESTSTATLEPTTEPTSGNPEKPWLLKKGAENPNSKESRARREAEKKAREERANQSAPGDFDLLSAMRYVYSNEPKLDFNFLHKQCRRSMDENPQSFLSKIIELERQQEEKKRREQQPAGCDPLQELQDEKAYRTAKAFIARYVEDAEGGVIPGFSAHGLEAAKGMLHA